MCFRVQVVFQSPILANVLQLSPMSAYIEVLTHVLQIAAEMAHWSITVLHRIVNLSVHLLWMARQDLSNLRPASVVKKGVERCGELPRHNLQRIYMDILHTHHNPSRKSDRKSWLHNKGSIGVGNFLTLLNWQSIATELSCGSPGLCWLLRLLSRGATTAGISKQRTKSTPSMGWVPVHTCAWDQRLEGWVAFSRWSMV